VNQLNFRNKLKCDHELTVRRALLDNTLALSVTNECKFEKGEWVNPAIQFTSSQLAPFTLSGAFNPIDRGFNLKIDREKQDSEKLAYSTAFTFTENQAALNQVVGYELTNQIDLTANMTFSTDEKIQMALGVYYKLAKDKKLSVNFVENFKRTTLEDSMVVLGYQY
jgi:hypothetical protein